MGSNNKHRLILIIALILILIAIVSILPTDEFEEVNTTHEKLNASINSNNSEIVYFYRPDCPACNAVSNIIIKTSKENNIKLKMFNTAEEDFESYDISVVPTIIQYENGSEVKRIEKFHKGEESKEVKQFFKDIKN